MKELGEFLFNLFIIIASWIMMTYSLFNLLITQDLIFAIFTMAFAIILFIILKATIDKALED